MYDVIKFTVVSHFENAFFVSTNCQVELVETGLRQAQADIFDRLRLTSSTIPPSTGSG